MYIDTVPNRNSPPAILLREGWREGGTVKKRTLANLSKWPPEVVEGLRVLLKGGTAVKRLPEAFEIERSLPHGHAAAALGAIERLGLPRLIDAQPSPQRDRVVALIAARILHPGSKLAAARGLAEETARDTLGETLGLGEVSEDDLYAAMDWLLTRQDAIERRLAKRRLKEGTLVLYDLTSVYLEGRRCPLAKRGHSRDGKRGKLQIEFGLLCDAEGCPVAVEVFKGNAADPSTVGAQIKKLKDRFGLKRVVLVGDRGMLTEARIREEVKPAGLDFIGALRSSAIRSLVESGAVQMSLFDQTDLIEVRSDAYPGERLMVCRNPQLAQERARKREDLLQATEKLLAPIAAATKREKSPLTGQDKIALRVGKVIGKYKMHFVLDIKDKSFGYRRDAESIGRSIRGADQPAGVGTRRRRDGARLQALKRRGAGLSKPQDGGPESAARVPLHGGSGARPCPARPITSNGICADGLNPCCSTTRTRTAPRRPAPRWRARESLRIGPAQGAEQTNRKRPARAQLPDAADLATVAKNRVVCPGRSRSPWSTALQSEAFRAFA